MVSLSRNYFDFLLHGIEKNDRAMGHDEKKYPDPSTFNPERFLDESGNINDDDRILAYGFGRRCVPAIVLSRLTRFA